MNWNPGNVPLTTILIWTIIAFCSGSLMFSYWLGRLALKRDIREVGDGNPGTANVIKAGGAKLGAVAFLLDFLKGSIPVAIARYGFGIYGFALLPVCFAAIFGHAYSPFLRFKGGKAMAVTAGVFTGITFWETPTLGGIVLGVMFAFHARSGWAVVFTFGCMFVYYALTSNDRSVLALVAGTMLFMAWKYRADLRYPLEPRDWLKRRLGRMPTP
ncbi:MAG: glycerol-3-phosphate acyltransferase [Chloroflexota bacterium]|nr:glycerol-3-phosphate acyltransferase [Chloroflexota bacterium]